MMAVIKVEKLGYMSFSAIMFLLPVKEIIEVNRNLFKSNLIPAELSAFKTISQFHYRQMYEHWSTDHNSDGTLKPGVKSSSISLHGPNKPKNESHV